MQHVNKWKSIAIAVAFTLMITVLVTLQPVAAHACGTHGGC
jgi:hypothetical protein